MDFAEDSFIDKTEALLPATPELFFLIEIIFQACHVDSCSTRRHEARAELQ